MFQSFCCYDAEGDGSACHGKGWGFSPPFIYLNIHGSPPPRFVFDSMPNCNLHNTCVISGGDPESVKRAIEEALLNSKTPKEEPFLKDGVVLTYHKTFVN
jgi:hypothetical protein